MKFSFIMLDIIRKFYRTAFWDGWREKKCQFGLLVGEIQLLKIESLPVASSSQFEMRVRDSERYEEAGYLLSCQMVQSCGIGDPLNSNSAKDTVIQADTKAAFAVHATI